MAPSLATFVLISCALCVCVSRADVSSLGYNQYNRPNGADLQRQQSGPYPASGFRPDRQFNLPGEQTQFVSQSRPNTLYSAPARLRQRAPARLRLQQQQHYVAPARQQLQPQQTYGAPQQSSSAVPQQLYSAPQQNFAAPERLTAARLTDNREDQEDEEDTASASEIEVNIKEEEKKPAATPSPAPAPATPTIVYYPAGAVGFVHPASAAYYQPAAAYVTTNYIAQLQAAQNAALAAAAPTTPATTAPTAAASSPDTATASATPATAATAPAATAIAPQYLATAPFSYVIPAAQLRAW